MRFVEILYKPNNTVNVNYYQTLPGLCKMSQFQVLFSVCTENTQSLKADHSAC